MAGAILAEHVPALVVETRGTHVVEGMPMSWRTRDAIVALGARADGHRSRQLSTADLTGADVVLAMAGEHVEYVRRRHPEAAARTGTLKRLARDLPGAAGTLAERVASLRLDEVVLEPWEDVDDPGRRRPRGVPPLRGRDPRAAEHAPPGAARNPGVKHRAPAGAAGDRRARSGSDAARGVGDDRGRPER